MYFWINNEDIGRNRRRMPNLSAAHCATDFQESSFGTENQWAIRYKAQFLSWNAYRGVAALWVWKQLYVFDAVPMFVRVTMNNSLLTHVYTLHSLPACTE